MRFGGKKKQNKGQRWDVPGGRQFQIMCRQGKLHWEVGFLRRAKGGKDESQADTLEESLQAEGSTRAEALERRGKRVPQAWRRCQPAEGGERPGGWAEVRREEEMVPWRPRNGLGSPLTP